MTTGERNGFMSIESTVGRYVNNKKYIYYFFVAERTYLSLTN